MYRLSGNVRGVLWMAASALAFSIMSISVKFVGANVSSFQIVFFRASVGFLVLLPFLFPPSKGQRLLKTQRPFMHLLRGLLGFFAMSTNFYAMTAMPLAPALAISFSSPVFMTIPAAIFLKEKPDLGRFLCTVIGFLGMLLMLRPGGDLPFVPSIIALMGAVAVACVVIVIKKLSATEDPFTTLFYFSALTGTFAVILAPLGWQDLEPAQWLLLAGVGCFGSLGQYLMLRAYRVGELTAVSPASFLQLMLGGIAGFVIFNEVLDWATLAGCGLIAASALLITWLETRRSGA